MSEQPTLTDSDLLKMTLEYLLKAAATIDETADEFEIWPDRSNETYIAHLRRDAAHWRLFCADIEEKQEGTFAPTIRPAIINISYRVDPCDNLELVKLDSSYRPHFGPDVEKFKAANIERLETRDGLIRLCYSSDYEIVKNEYIAAGSDVTETLHHLIARRIEDYSTPSATRRG